MTIRVVVPILVGQLQSAATVAAAAAVVDVIIVVARHRRHHPPCQIFQPFRRGGLCHEYRRRAVGG